MLKKIYNIIKNLFKKKENIMQEIFDELHIIRTKQLELLSKVDFHRDDSENPLHKKKFRNIGNSIEFSLKEIDQAIRQSYQGL